jgi:SOS-response transcriptional repressor LexA
VSRRSISPRYDRYADGQIVLAFVNGQAVVRQLSRETLLPADERFPVIELDESCVIRGRVVAAITFLKAPRFALPDAA